MSYRYQGHRVFIPPAAEVSRAFRPNDSLFGEVVQAVLNEIEPWEKGEDPIETFSLPQQIGARVVVLASNESPGWAINPYHKARQPGLSPYIALHNRDPRRYTDTATLELAGTISSPILTRAYPGTYMPPLPWMKSAKKAPGGEEECIEYWGRHAFLHYRSGPELLNAAPEWYRPGPAQGPSR